MTRGDGIHRPPRVAGRAVASSILAVVVLVVGWLSAVSLHPGFDPVRQPISDLTAADAPNRWVMTGALMVLGIGHVVTARGLRPADPTGRWLLAAGGISMVLLALVPNRTVGSYYLAHTYWSALTFGFLALWPATSARFGDRVPWPLRMPVALAASVVTFALILLTVLGIITESSDLGLREGALYAWTTVWPLIVVSGARRSVFAPARP